MKAMYSDTSISDGILVEDDSGWFSASLNIGEVQKMSMIHQDSGENKVRGHISGLKEGYIYTYFWSDLNIHHFWSYHPQK